MKNFSVRAMALAACLTAFALPASAEWIGFHNSTEAASGPIGQTWTGEWADGSNRYEWFSDMTIDGNKLSYQDMAAGGRLGTQKQTYVFTTAATSTGELKLGIDLTSNLLWEGSSTAMYIWQGSTDTRMLLANGTNESVVHSNVTLNLSAGEKWGFMAVSGSIDDDNEAFTGPLWGSFTITDPATPADSGGDVPEPASLALLGLGMLGLATVRRKKA